MNHNRLISSLLAGAVILSNASGIIYANDFQEMDANDVVLERSEPEPFTKTENINTKWEGYVVTVSGNGTLTLRDAIAEEKVSIVIEKGANVILDLAGFKLTNVDDQDTIQVKSGATLTINGNNGTVDNTSNGKAAVFNNGTVILNGGIYSKSNETKGNSWYTLCNHGTMTIRGNVRVRHGEIATNNSSLIENGYYNYSNTGNDRLGYVEGTNSPAPTLTIENGDFYGGIATVKNDDGGVLNISGGTFKGYGLAVQNVNIATITGGSFGLTDNAPENSYTNAGIIHNDLYGESAHGKGELKISGQSTINAPEGRKHVFSEDHRSEDDKKQELEYTPVVITYAVQFTGEGYKPQTGDDIVFTKEPSKPVTPSKPADSKKVEMYRLYNPNTGEHFYTSNEAEKNNLVSKGWKHEPQDWISPSYSDIPVYRVYNPNAGDHHYTMDRHERDVLVSLGWKDEGTGWYSDTKKRTPVYRVYNPHATVGTHHYTTNLAEARSLESVGWTYEGICWYGM